MLLHTMGFSTVKRILFIITACAAIIPLPDAAAHPFPLFFQERNMWITYEPAPDQSFTQRFGVSAFSGDFPLVVHADADEFSLYSGVPLFMPIFTSLGTTNQIGYLDSYRVHTPFYLLSAGWRAHKLMSLEPRHSGWFASWGWRTGRLSGGLAYHFNSQEPTAHLGLSLSNAGITATLSPDYLKTTLALRTSNSWSIRCSVILPWDHTPQISIGFGLSRREYQADYLLSQEWDMKIAHRGTIRHAPENTSAAFSWALEQPQFIGIEADIQKTKDDKFVVIHDPIMLRYTGKPHRITSMTLGELREYDMGSWFSPEFADQRIKDLNQLADLCNRNPEVYWFLEIKSYTWSEDDVIQFLKLSDELFAYHEKILFYTLNQRMLQLMKAHTDRPVGLQLDSSRMMIFASDHVIPLLPAEYGRALKHADFFTIISHKYDRFPQISSVADALEIPFLYWNFDDTMFGYIPESVQSYPLGIRGIESGSIRSQRTNEEYRSKSDGS